MRALAIVTGQQLTTSIFGMVQKTGQVHFNTYDDISATISGVLQECRSGKPIMLQAFDAQSGRPMTEQVLLTGSEDDDAPFECFLNQISMAIDENEPV
jgi:hypothetical protein